MFYTLKYIQKNVPGLCASDLLTKSIKVELINVNFISSVSSLIDFRKPLTDSFVANYAIVTMNNSDYYQIRQSEWEELMEFLKNKSL